MNINQFKFSTSEAMALSIAVLWMILGIVADAMGAHLFASFLENKALNNMYSPAVRHLFYGGLGSLILVLLFNVSNKRYFVQSAWLLHSGVLLFSGTLLLIFVSKVYMSVQLTFLGRITPFGGLLMILAWLWTFVGLIRKK
jgi:uncharacterized membrane protein YgdD (TMEM256/DUF423 family)